MRLILLSVFASRLLFAGACCTGSSTKLFSTLKHLQRYDFGISSTLKDTYGRFNDYGNLVATGKQQRLELTASSSLRLTEITELSIALPFVYSVKNIGKRQDKSASLGDIAAGFKWTLLDPLFQDDWFPKLVLLSSIKFPSGSSETGNGLWEPGLSLLIQKDIGPMIFALTPSYTKGNRFDLTESIQVPLDRKWSAGLGSTQSWTLNRSYEGKELSDTWSRNINLFLTSSYLIDPFYSVAFSFESTLPFSKFGKTVDATRSITISLQYAVF